MKNQYTICESCGEDILQLDLDSNGGRCHRCGSEACDGGNAITLPLDRIILKLDLSWRCKPCETVQNATS